MIPALTLITEAPIWFVLLCVLAGAVVSLLLYFRNPDQALDRKLRILLGIIRFFAYSVMAFLLLTPLVKNFVRDREPPLVVLAVDNSSSMLINSRDSAADAAFLKQVTDNISGALEDRYTVEKVTFGETVRDTVPVTFGEKETDMASVLSMVETRHAGRNRGAVIILSDGIYNKGLNPTSLLSRLPVPVYTATWGDTAIRRDLVLAEVNYNRIAYLGNDFPLEIAVRGVRCNGMNTRLVVRNREKTLVNQPLQISGEMFTKIIQLNLTAEKEGFIDLDISLEPVNGEVTLVNNRMRAFIEVLNSRKKVLLLAAAPHPDLGAMQSALEQNDRIESEVVMLNAFNAPLASYDLVILHQLPTDQRSTDLLNKCAAERIPLLIIGGGKTRQEFISRAGAGPAIVAGKAQGEHNEVIATVNPAFTLFNPNQDFTGQLQGLPPLFVPFGKYEPKPGEQILLYQKIGKVITSYPLISFYQLPGHRTGFIAGEGIWKWRMFSFRNTKSHKAFDGFFQQLVQYLTVNEERSRFKVSTRNYLPENESVVFTAELYNAAFVPVTDPEVTLEVTASNGKKYDYTFSRRDNLYHLELGRMPVGEYTYKSSTTLGSERFSASGKFIVAPVQIESTITRADHNLLKALSAQSVAVSAPAADWKTITDHIRNRDDIKPISHLREKFVDLTAVFWLLMTLILLLGTEWFLRKWAGTY
ncbi:MAG TPA: VWA domain-containing protein [Bacteroidales bacterium]|nr:VWA domain-containing protein [Bacteroidales bacterium]HRZ49867.1 VWA domain-containing protein [Bacteroidales bacterium]